MGIEEPRPPFGDRHLRESVVGFSTVLALKCVAAALVLAFNVLLARSLGAEAVGVFYVGQAIVTVAATVGLFGQHILALRDVAAASGAVAVAYARACAVAAATAGATAAGVAAVWVALSLSGALAAWLEGPVVWMLLAIVPLALQLLHDHVLQGVRRFAEATLVSNVVVPAVGILAVPLLVPPFGLAGAVAAYLLAVAAALAFGAWRCAVRIGPPRPDLSTVRRDLRRGRPFLAVAALHAAWAWGPLLLVGLLLTAVDAGVFGAAFRINLVLNFLGLACSAATAPLFAELHARRDRPGLAGLVRRSTLLVTLAAVPVFLVVAFGAGSLMGLFGPEFAAGRAVLLILVAGQLVGVVTGASLTLLLMTGHEDRARLAMVGGVLVMIGVGVPAALLHGAPGVAFGYAVGMLVERVLAIRFVVGLLGIVPVPFWGDFARRP